VVATFAPTTASSYSTAGTFSGGGGDSVTLTGTATNAAAPPLLGYGPATLAFGSIYRTNSATGSVNLTNTGGGQLDWSIAAAGDFSAAPASGSLLNAQRTTVTVTYAPATAGADAETLTITVPGTDGTVACTGTGTNYPAALAISRPSISFGTVLTNTSLTIATVATNTGETTLVGGQVTAAGTGFAITLPVGGTFSLAPGVTVTVNTRFTPTAAGVYAGTNTYTGGTTINQPLEGSGEIVPPVPPTRTGVGPLTGKRLLPVLP
jgi:hypothetical protein